MSVQSLSETINGLIGGGATVPRVEFQAQRLPRRRLWEVDKHMHCPIVGTCLSLADLERAIHKAGVSWTQRPQDIDIHHVGVSKAREDCRLSRILTKLLDKRYARHLKKYAQFISSAELETAWQAALEAGEVPGALWALATHPAADENLLEKVHGDVHMLSHLNGASHRAELARLKALEKESAGLQESLHTARQRQRQAILSRDTQIRELEAQVAKLRNRMMDDAGSRYLEQELDTARRRLGRAQTRAERAETRLAEREQQLDEYARDKSALQELLEETRAELAMTERRLLNLLDQDGSEDTPGSARLEGQRVLYIGGRASLTPHLRRLVEQMEGRFTYHDGGLEDNRARLEEVAQSADLVFCPVDCISHDACQRAKSVCRQHGARFLPLRSAGLSSFAAALERLSETAAPVKT